MVDDGNTDLTAMENAIRAAQNVTNKPSLIKIRTIIGFGSKMQGEEKVHGAPLGEEDLKQVKSKFGFDPEQKFVVPDEVYQEYHAIAARGLAAYTVFAFILKLGLEYTFPRIFKETPRISG